MMRTIHLYGRLRKQFGKSFRFDVLTAGEAFRALYSAFGGPFLETLREGHYKVMRGDRRTGFPIHDPQLLNSFQLGKADLHIIPVAAGSGKNAGGLKAIAGLVLVGAAIFFSGGTLAAPLAGLGGTAFSLGGLAVTWGNIALLGLGLTLAGASQLLAQSDAGPAKDQDKQTSHAFSGPQNTSAQGVAKPLIYGEVMTGSILVSADFEIEDIGAYSNPFNMPWSQIIGVLRGDVVTG